MNYPPRDVMIEQIHSRLKFIKYFNREILSDIDLKSEYDYVIRGAKYIHWNDNRIISYQKAHNYWI